MLLRRYSRQEPQPEPAKAEPQSWEHPSRGRLLHNGLLLTPDGAKWELDSDLRPVRQIAPDEAIIFMSDGRTYAVPPRGTVKPKTFQAQGYDSTADLIEQQRAAMRRESESIHADPEVRGLRGQR